MKYTFTILLACFLFFNVDAQLKQVQFGDTPVASDAQIVPPKGKRVVNQRQNTPHFNPRNIQYVEHSANGLKVTHRNSSNQLPLFIEGTPSKTLRSNTTIEGKAYNFLFNAQPLMKIDDPEQEFKIKTINLDEIGMTHVKMQQEYNGIPIYGAEVIFHTSASGQSLNGRYKASFELDVKPEIIAESAESKAIADIGGLTTIENDKFNLFDFEKVTNNLVIYFVEEEPKLAYHLTIYKNLVDRWEYFVGAKSGEILNKYINICKFHNHDSDEVTSHAGCTHNVHIGNANMPPPDGPVVSNASDLFGVTRAVNTYEVSNKFYMIDASRTMFDNQNSNIPDNPVGTVWTIDAFDTSPQNSNFTYDHVTSNSSSFSGKASGVSAQYNGGQAYMYFKNVHNRESINGEGGNVIGLINISDEDGSSLGNAFWNGIAMFYGSGDNSFQHLARGLDVAGHEMSHGVVQSTANLEYRGESGALNESFADIFGAMIDREDWLIGEDVVKLSAFPSGALRNMSNPHNGAATGDFNGGWQPRVYSERFTGSQDNGGVHINSGIPNWAFFKFASNSAVGKSRAEDVYYRALTNYLTKSSQFIDCRLAVVKAAEDLYGTGVANAAKQAFDEVEIFNGSGTNNQTDVNVNPGSDLIIFTTEEQNNLYIASADGTLIFDPLTEQDPISVPSVTDDGSEILFVNSAGELYYIRIDWSDNSIVEEGVIQSNDKYRNAVFSRDGLRLAALREAENNEIFVYDFESSAGTTYELFNPTFTEGVATGDVIFADAMEFDYQGEYLMYDAFNRLEGQFGADIEYWDIGFIKVFDLASKSFTLGSDIQKLFSQLPENVSIGNPTFSKNSEYIIAFDFIQNNEFEVKAANIETGEVGDIFTGSNKPGYPSYSLDDDKMIFDADDNTGVAVVASAQLQENKIQAVPNTAQVQLGFQTIGVKWGVWFGNGDRVLADDDIQLADEAISVFPNPAKNSITLTHKIDDTKDAIVSIIDIMGRVVLNKTYNHLVSNATFDISNLPTGQYIFNVRTKSGVGSEMFVKQ